VAESLSDTSRCNFFNYMQNWGTTVLRGVREFTAPYMLSEEETDALLRANYGAVYPQYHALREQHMMPLSFNKDLLRLRLVVPGWCAQTWDYTIRTTTSLPILQENELNNTFQMNSDHWHHLLPQRIHDDAAQLLRFTRAMDDVVKCTKEYSRARYLLAQWPSAALMMPKHVRTSLTHRRFQRGLPKDLPLLQQETLDTLALMSLLEPIPENKY
jgi:hypothetical protein